MKQNPKRYHRIAIVISTLTVLALGLTGAYAYRKHRNNLQTDSWRNDGIAADKSGEYPKAIEKLELSLSRRPEDREALLAYIDARPRVESPKLAHLADTARAIRYLLQQDPTLLDYREKLLSLYQQMRLRTEALDTADTLLKSDPRNEPALQARAIMLAELRRYDDAASATAAWIEVEPLNLNGQILHLSLMRQLGRSTSEVNGSVAAWGKSHPDQTARFELLNGIAFGQSGDRANALLWLRKASQQTPPDPAFSHVLIAQLAEIGEPGDDVAVLQKLSDHGAQADVRESLLCRRWELGQWKDAVDISSKIDLTAASTSADVIALASMARKNLKDDSGSDKLIEVLTHRTDATSIAWANILRAPTADARAWRAVAEQCRTALASNAGNSYLRYFLGEALAATGETELAVEAFEFASNLNPTWGLPPARLAELLLLQGNLQASAQAASVSLHRTPNASAALTIARVVATLDQKGLIDQQTLGKLVDELERVLPGNENVALMRVQSLVRANARDKAVEQIRTFLTVNPPPSEPALLKLAQLSSNAHLNQEADILIASEKLHGMTPKQTLAAAMHDASSGNAEDGLKRIDAASRNSLPPAKRDWAFVRAQFLDGNGDKLAPAQWRSVTTDYPTDVAVQEAAMSSRAMHLDRTFVEATIQRLRTVLGEQSLVCALARVQLLVTTRANDADDREIAETLRQVIAAHPGMAEPRILWAEHLEHAGNIDGAIEQLENAQRISNSETTLSLKLASLYAARGDSKKSREQLDRVGRATSVDGDELLAAAHLFASLGDYAHATAMLEKHSQTSDRREALLLAELYWHQNLIDKVESIIPTIESAGTPQAIEFVARFRASQGTPALAEQTIAKLDGLQIAPAEKCLALGNFLAATGRTDDATRQYRQATVDAPKDVVAWKTLVAHLVSTDHAADAATVAQSAASALPPGNQFADVAQNISNWSAAFALGGMKPLALQFIANPVNGSAARDILSTVARAQTADDPLATLNAARTLVQRYPGVESVTLWVVSVELRLQRTTEAETQLADAMKAFPNSEDASAMLTRLLLARQRWQDGLSAAKAWRGRSSQHLQPDIAQARALIGLNRAEEATQLLQGYSRNGTRPADVGADFFITYAAALRASNKAPEAEAILLNRAAEGTDWRGACLQFATSKLKGAEARKWILKVAASLDTASSTETLMLARAWAVFVALNPSDSADMKEASRLFDSVTSRADVTAAALEQAGMFAEQSGNTASALSLYTRCVQMDARRPIAQNNLAMLIASTGGNLSEAKNHATIAITTNRAEPAFLDTLAMIKTKAGDKSGAVESLRRAIDLDPDNPKWRIALAESFLSGGRTAEASDALSSIDSIVAEPATFTPKLRNKVDELRARISRSQTVNASAAIPLTVNH